MGGPVFGLKRAIDEGVTVGPRIYPSGAMISQTSGHGDFRSRYEVPRANGRTAEPVRAGGYCSDRRQPRRGPAADARATAAGSQSDQADGRRRRQFSTQPDRVDAIHRTRAACRGRGGRKLGHLCSRACVYAGYDPASDRRRCQMYRAWSVDRRAHGQVAGGQGHLVEVCSH